LSDFQIEDNRYFRKDLIRGSFEREWSSIGQLTEGLLTRQLATTENRFSTEKAAIFVNGTIEFYSLDIGLMSGAKFEYF